MPRTTGLRRTLVATAFACLPFAPAQAVEEGTEFWPILTIEGEPAEDVSASLEVNPRFRGKEAGGDLLQTRATIDYRLSDSVAVGGGLLYAEFAGGNETRTHQQVTVRSGRLAFRTRLEERFFAGADRMELRLRQRVQLTLPVRPGTSFVASGEAYGILRSRNESGNTRLDQWRGQLSVRQRLSPRVELSGGYLLIYYPAEGRADRIAHVPQVGLNLRL